MTDAELIARQAKQIEELKASVQGYESAIRKCHNIAYRIGGPLNDNLLAFTPKQQKVIWDMINTLDAVENQ